MRRRPVEVVALAATNVLQRHHAGDRVLEAERLHELALRVGAGRDHRARADRTHGLDHLQPGGVEQRRAVRAVVQQHRLAGPRAGALQHGLRRRAAGLADEGQVVAGRGAVEGQRAAVGQQLEAAREGGFAGMRDGVVGQPSTVLALVFARTAAPPRPPTPPRRLRGTGVYSLAKRASVRSSAPTAPCVPMKAARAALDTPPVTASPARVALFSASRPVPVAAPSTNIDLPGAMRSVVNSARTMVPRFRM